MRKKNTRPMRVTVSNAPELSDVEKLAKWLGVPVEKAIPEVIRRINKKGESA